MSTCPDPPPAPDDGPQGWACEAVRSCLKVWCRTGPRYARRLRARRLLRDPVPDLMTLAARAVVPLPRAVARPLPWHGQGRWARAFDRLDLADRRALMEGEVPGAMRGARAEHLASALERWLDRAAEESREV